MAGNEIDVVRFLLNNLGKIKLNHLGLVDKIGAPILIGGFTKVTSIEELTLISTEDAGKKADIYINEKGVSIKQLGASFSFNRLQRADLLDLFSNFGFKNPEANLQKFDKEVADFHNELIQNRSRPWENLFDERDFKKILKYLMMEGSPNLGNSSHPAEFILEAPKNNISQNNINVYTFDEYFDTFKQKIYCAIRRGWIGQSSNSEHRRAMGIASKSGNEKWVFDTISGQPRVSKATGKRWRDEIPEDERKTVYMIFFEKKI